MRHAVKRYPTNGSAPALPRRYTCAALRKKERHELSGSAGTPIAGNKRSQQRFESVPKGELANVPLVRFQAAELMVNARWFRAGAATPKAASNRLQRSPRGRPSRADRRSPPSAINNQACSPARPRRFMRSAGDLPTYHAPKREFKSCP